MILEIICLMVFSLLDCLIDKKLLCLCNYIKVKQ